MTINTTAVFANVFTGTVPNDGTGDSLLDAFVKVNGNFANINSIGLSAGNISITGSAEIGDALYVNSTAESTSISTGALVVAGGAGIAKNLYVGGNLSVQGTTITINTEVVNIEEIIIGNSFTRGTVFAGNNISYSPIAYTNPLFVGTTSANTYVQGAIQNQSGGTQASSDWIATADTGTDTARFIDMGINGSNYSVATWTVSGALDGYLYVNSGNLTLGTDTADKTVKIHTGGTLAANVVATFNAANTAATTTATGAMVVAGGVGVSGTVYAGNLTVVNWGNIGNIQAVQIGNVGATHTGTTYFGVGTATFGNLQAPVIGNISANISAGNVTISNYANVGNLQAVQIGNVGATHTGTTYFGVGTATFGNVQSQIIGNVSANITAGNTTINNYANVGNIQAVQIGNVGTTHTGTTYLGVGTATFGVVNSPIIGNSGAAITGVVGNTTPSPAQFTFLRTTSTTLAIANDSLLHGQGNIGNTSMAFGNVNANAFVAMSSTGAYPPLKLNPGANVVATVNGAVEFDGNVFYTPTNAGRGITPTKWMYILGANVNISTGNADPVLGVPYSLLNGAQATAETPLGFNANVGTYEFEGLFGVFTGTVAHAFNFGFGLSSGVISTIQYEVQFGNISNFMSNGGGFSQSGNTFSTMFWDNTAGGLIGPNNLLVDNAAYIKVKGIVRFTSAGKFVPTVYWTGASDPGASTLSLRNSFFKVEALGTTTVTTIGNWS